MGSLCPAAQLQTTKTRSGSGCKPILPLRVFFAPSPGRGLCFTGVALASHPGGPFLSEKAVSDAAQKALEAKYGLDKPLMEQYVTYLKDIATKFDFGPSIKLRGRQVIDVIMDGMKTSAKLGLVAALCRNSIVDKVIMVITTAFVSMALTATAETTKVDTSNMTPAEKAAAEAEIRYAISLLYDRNYIVEEIGQAGQVPASSFVSMGMTDADGSQFYKNAGHNDGFDGYWDVSEDAYEDNFTKAIEILSKYYDYDETIVVTLNNALSYWDELLAFPAFFPVREDVVADEGWCTDAATFVSNGAYKMTGWDHNSVITLTKNDNYWDAENVTMQEIKFYLSDDANNMLTNFKNGDWLLIDDVPTNEIASLKEAYPTEFVVAGQIGTYYVCWNINKTLLP